MIRRSFFKRLIFGYLTLKNALYADSKKDCLEEEPLKIGEIKHKVCFIGVGGGGTNIVEDIANIDDKHRFIHLNTDEQALKRKKSGTRILLKNKDRLGCGGKIQCGIKSVTPQVKKQIYTLTKDFSKVYVISTLGGGVSSGATPEIVKYLQSKLNKKVVVFSVMPFSFEGKKRLSTAIKSRDKISIYASEHFTLQNDELLDKRFSQSIRTTLNKMSKNIYNMLNNIEKG